MLHALNLTKLGIIQTLAYFRCKETVNEAKCLLGYFVLVSTTTESVFVYHSYCTSSKPNWLQVCSATPPDNMWLTCTYTSRPEDSGDDVDVDESAVRSYKVIQSCGHGEDIWKSTWNKRGNSNTCYYIWWEYYHCVKLANTCILLLDVWFYDTSNVTLLLHDLTYMSNLYLHKSCCLLVYPCGQVLRFGAAIQRRAESLVEKSCWSKEHNQASLDVNMEIWRNLML